MLNALGWKEGGEETTKLLQAEATKPGKGNCDNSEILQNRGRRVREKGVSHAHPNWALKKTYHLQTGQELNFGENGTAV